MTFKETAFISIIIIFMLNVIMFGDDNLYINSNCQLNEEEQGICKYLTDCKSAINDLINNITKPKICSFDRHKAIVCCKLVQNIEDVTEDNSEPLIINTRKSDIMLKSLLLVERISQNRCKNLYESEIRKVYGKGRRRTTPSIIKNDRLFKRQISTTTEMPDLTLKTVTYNSTKPSILTTPRPISGGKSVLYKQYPFMVAIGWETFHKTIEFKCGGTLVESNFVITAAHCIDIGGAKPTVIRTGGVNLDEDVLINGDILIADIFIHPNYTKHENYNDIAIIKLAAHSIDKPACLYPRHEIDGKYQYVKAIGYGQTQFAGPSSQSLLQIQINLIENENCGIYYPPEEKFPNSIIDSQICANDPRQIQDTCPGDSGGPIFIEENIEQFKKINITYVVGVTSFGKFCAGQAPGVYTRISSYLDWIESIIWPNN